MTQPDLAETIYRIDERLATLKSDFHELKETVENNYVRQDEFSPVRRIIYGLVGLALTSIFTAILALILRSHSPG